MPIRKITTTEELRPWLPSVTAPWSNEQIQAALDEGYHPRLIAAEIWEEWALTQGKAEYEAEGRKVISAWQNGEVSVDYALAQAPREYGLHMARYHRSRAPIRSVAFAARNTDYEEG